MSRSQNIGKTKPEKAEFQKRTIFLTTSQTNQTVLLCGGPGGGGFGGSGGGFRGFLGSSESSGKATTATTEKKIKKPTTRTAKTTTRTTTKQNCLVSFVGTSSPFEGGNFFFHIP